LKSENQFFILLIMLNDVIIDSRILNSQFVQEKASQSLRVCCYGSSSSRTPDKYLDAARSIGYILARRGHTCVNGAGSCGCMAAMNDGAAKGNGHIVGVIHEMFLVDSPDWDITRDGGAHPVFAGCLDEKSEESKQRQQTGPTCEILIAGGNDLQERKRLLVDKSDALVVLPGGPGTWDELWEMACARQIGLSSLPIVCVNVDGFYDPFRTMLERAGKDDLLHLEPSKIVHFEETAEDAVKWIENTSSLGLVDVKLKRRSSTLRRSSFLHNPILGKNESWISGVIRRSSSIFAVVAPEGQATITEIIRNPFVRGTAIFTSGLALGIFLSQRRQNHVSFRL
jgi:uncharacterized protein (TIGR00730 family)